MLGAIDSHSQEIISVTTEGTVNAPPVTLVLDNARYQRCRDVAIHAMQRDIELLYLPYIPAYSPSLNLIGRLWELTKKKCLTKTHYQNFKDFRAAIDDCLGRMAGEYLPELKSLITVNFESLHFPQDLMTRSIDRMGRASTGKVCREIGAVAA